MLLTDGEGHEGDPLVAARLAADQDVVIHAIGIGSPAGEPIPIRDANGTVIDYKKDAQGETVLSRLDEVILQQLVSATGGYYFRANASGTEVDAVADLIEGMATGEREESGELETFGVERFQWFVGLAVIVLSVETLMNERHTIRSGDEVSDGHR